MSKAKRYNTGKTRFELIPRKPLELLAEVYTKGAHKYTVYADEQGNRILGKDISVEEVAKRKLIILEDGSDNWRLGQQWTASAASTLRHIEAFLAGEDFDKELGTYHLANAAWGLFSLLEYYHAHPELDNRNHRYLQPKRIGLDIDEVIADFTGSWMEVHGGERPVYWNYVRDMVPKLKSLDKDFWLNMKPRVDPKGLPFEPHCYITARVIPTAWTEEWLEKNGFPLMPVITIEPGQSKVEVAKAQGIDIFVDDRYEYFADLNRNGVCCFLMDAPHNQRYDVGYKRIKSLSELVVS